MRCFISINLDDDLKREIETATETLRKTRSDVKWVTVENLHITLKFLGEIHDDLIPAVKERLSQVSLSHAPSEIKLHGAGIFPDSKRPRVIWLGMKDSDRLKKLQADIEDSMATLGFEKEGRGFSPHLTIGRVRSMMGKDPLVRAVGTLKDKDFGNIEVKRVSLMKSELRPAGAQYAPVAEFDLKNEEER